MLDSSGNIETDSRKIAEAVLLPIINCDEDLTTLPEPSLDQIPRITPQILLIKRRKPKTSTGPDGIPPFVVKKIAGVLADPLSCYYNQSFETCEVPVQWKLAYVTPIYKNKGPKPLTHFTAIRFRHLSIDGHTLDVKRDRQGPQSKSILRVEKVASTVSTVG
eukprot:GHVN01049079.1.p1 GENE.GHVN01049079.1~~GHVN01049079.1.p1  ORF type:complete len:162 (+),score=21.14 GHVN01049079.1:628-1113(+)